MRKIYFKTLGILCLGLVAFSASAQTTYYVKAGGTGTAATATTWATASGDLQDVINASQSGDKIFVAAGTYLPNRPANNLNVIDVANRDNAFVLKDGVSIYGGFTGTEANETQRVAGNTTILSGDLASDDVDETTANAASYMTLNKTDNAYHIVIALGITSATVFDGFTLTKGDASATSAQVIVLNTKNIDRRLGGGIYILESGANFKISNVTTINNRANTDGDSPGGGGAGFYINTSSPTIENCLISKCYSTHATPKAAGANYGSGMSIVLASSPTISNTTFSENFGGSGGAVGINGGATNASSPLFNNCTFRLNRGNTRGGAVDVRSSTPIFTACLFSENTAMGSGGAGVYNYTGRPTFYNCIFHKNNASTSNGAAYGSQTNNNGAVFVNNTFYDNRNTYGNASGNYSTGIFVAAVSTNTNYPDKKTYLYNNLFFGGVAQYNTNKTTIDLFVIDPQLIGGIDNNIIQQTAYMAAGQNNQSNVNPLFISTAFGNVAFVATQNASTAKDAGVDVHNPTTLDFYGRARKNGTIDIGAIEYHPNTLPVSFISFTAKATNEGTQLNWKVASETNNKQYIVSRSTDGKNYELLTKVQGALNSASALSYNYVDKAEARATYYYKLEQEDLDGTINYLATQIVKGTFLGKVNIYPNPTIGKTTIALTVGDYSKYSIVGLQGNIVLQGSIGKIDKELKLDLANLAKGTYFVKLTGVTANEFLRVIKL